MRLSRPFALAALGGVTAVALAAPAAAGPHRWMPVRHLPPAVAGQAQALRTLDREGSALRFAAFVVGLDNSVPTADASALLPTMNADITALGALRTTLAAETTAAGVQADLATLAGYHITDFVLPQASLVINADEVLAAVSNSATLQSRLQAAITAAQTAGKDVTLATVDLSDFSAQLTAAQQDAQAVHDAALALVAGQDNSAAISAARTQLGKASGELRKAFFDAIGVLRSTR